ncbi:hypothetical protein [Latilactobacillus sakei]|uniref:hypothetical protein n=1 Tax=Latilactobacillus sakei TaxID=1599 RepID=UPI000C1305EC|nr:hypothetical protein [Latilactobacillus sakei]SOB42728.1 hypothetical protein LSAJ112_140115 [Latilactobacillus sakei]
MTYVLLGMETQSVLYEADYRSEVNQYRLKANPSEPMAIINKRDLNKALIPTTTDSLRAKYFTPDTSERLPDESFADHHRRLGKQLRKLVNKGLSRPECLTEMGITNSLLTTIQNEQNIKFGRPKYSRNISPKKNKKIVEMVKSGASATEIATTVGVSVSYVYRMGFKSDSKHKTAPKPMLLIRDGKRLEFKSKSAASRFLNVSIEMFSRCLKYDKDIKGYSIIELTPEDVQA